MSCESVKTVRSSHQDWPFSKESDEYQLQDTVKEIFKFGFGQLVSDQLTLWRPDERKQLFQRAITYGRHEKTWFMVNMARISQCMFDIWHKANGDRAPKSYNIETSSSSIPLTWLIPTDRKVELLFRAVDLSELQVHSLKQLKKALRRIYFSHRYFEGFCCYTAYGDKELKRKLDNIAWTLHTKGYYSDYKFIITPIDLQEKKLEMSRLAQNIWTNDLKRQNNDNDESIFGLWKVEKFFWRGEEGTLEDVLPLCRDLSQRSILPILQAAWKVPAERRKTVLQDVINHCRDSSGKKRAKYLTTYYHFWLEGCGIENQHWGMYAGSLDSLMDNFAKLKEHKRFRLAGALGRFIQDGDFDFVNNIASSWDDLHYRILDKLHEDILDLPKERRIDVLNSVLYILKSLDDDEKEKLLSTSIKETKPIFQPGIDYTHHPLHVTLGYLIGQIDKINFKYFPELLKDVHHAVSELDGWVNILKQFSCYNDEESLLLRELIKLIDSNKSLSPTPNGKYKLCEILFKFDLKDALLKLNKILPYLTDEKSNIETLNIVKIILNLPNEFVNDDVIKEIADVVKDVTVELYISHHVFLFYPSVSIQKIVKELTYQDHSFEDEIQFENALRRCNTLFTNERVSCVIKMEIFQSFIQFAADSKFTVPQDFFENIIRIHPVQIIKGYCLIDGADSKAMLDASTKAILDNPYSDPAFINSQDMPRWNLEILRKNGSSFPHNIQKANANISPSLFYKMIFDLYRKCQRLRELDSDFEYYKGRHIQNIQDSFLLNLLTIKNNEISYSQAIFYDCIKAILDSGVDHEADVLSERDELLENLVAPIFSFEESFGKFLCVLQFYSNKISKNAGMFPSLKPKDGLVPYFVGQCIQRVLDNTLYNDTLFDVAKKGLSSNCNTQILAFHLTNHIYRHIGLRYRVSSIYMDCSYPIFEKKNRWLSEHIQKNISSILVTFFSNCTPAKCVDIMIEASEKALMQADFKAEVKSILTSPEHFSVVDGIEKLSEDGAKILLTKLEYIATA